MRGRRAVWVVERKSISSGRAWEWVIRHAVYTRDEARRIRYQNAAYGGRYRVVKYVPAPVAYAKLWKEYARRELMGVPAPARRGR